MSDNTWSITQLVQDAITPLFDNSSSATTSNILDFFLPKSREGVIQPQQTKRFFSGWQASAMPQSGGMQIMGTVQSLMKGIHTAVQVVSGVGNQLSVLFRNNTDKKVVLQAGHHMFRSVLKNVFKISPQIIPFVAEKKVSRLFGSKKIKKQKNRCFSNISRKKH